MVFIDTNQLSKQVNTSSTLVSNPSNESEKEKRDKIHLFIDICMKGKKKRYLRQLDPVLLDYGPAV